MRLESDLKKTLKISARKSDLARLQAYMVGEALQKQDPHLEIEYKFKESLGDKNLTDPLWKLPEKGVFTEDFFGELVRGETDMVVHSWKDLPTELKTQTCIVATLPRADQRDLLIVKKSDFSKIKASGYIKIFSSSPRRAYNLTQFLKDVLPFGVSKVEFESVRGNIQTRVRKMIESAEVSGLIVAKAAMDRLLNAPHAEFSENQKILREYFAQTEWMALPLVVNPNAAAQGALAVEIATDREDLKKLFSGINDTDTYWSAQEERKILASFGGGCHQKIGVTLLRRSYGDVLVLKGLTDQGAVLDRHEILSTSQYSFKEQEMWPPRGAPISYFDRERLETPAMPTNANALYVSKVDAWPEGFSFKGLIWTAGLRSWKLLAQQGVWVHGCSENMGENEPTGAESLAFEPLHWYKLSHLEGTPTKDVLATYKLIPSAAKFDFANKKSFFWRSGSLFLSALSEHPEIATAHHACGPGHTHDVITSKLKSLNVSPKVEIFLSQDEWRSKCQIQTTT